MNTAIPISDDIYWVGVNDRETDLFETLWPLPHGVSYNAYLIRDSKVALIDTVKGEFLSDHSRKIKEVLQQGRTIDYLIINHMEPDHSSSITHILELFPDIQIIGNEKTKDLLSCFYAIEKNLKIIGDGDLLDLGKHTLKFILTPMVHWPETMMTYAVQDKVLFSADAFGGFGAVDEGLFDSEVTMDRTEAETLRYFANIIGRYSVMVQNALTKLRPYDIRVVASTHGPVWKKDPQKIIDLYNRWSRQQTDAGVVIVYASMYGNTKKMVETVAQVLSDKGIHVSLHNLSHSHPSYILRDVWKHRGLVLACPTYNTGLFPLMAAFVDLLENKMIKNHSIGILSSYAWAGGAVKALKDYAQNAKLEIVEPVVEVKCAPTQDDLKNCMQLAENLAKNF